MTHKVDVSPASHQTGGWYAMCLNCSWGTWNPSRWYVRLKAWWHRRTS